MSKIKSLNEMGAEPKTPQVQIKASDLEDIMHVIIVKAKYLKK